jgi:CRP/FNR family transcriptional regulator
MDKNSAILFFLSKFTGSDDEELRQKLLPLCITKKLNKKEILFFEGQEGKYVYFLISGQIKLFRTNEEGKEAIIHFVKPGDIFAEILLHLKNTYPVTAMAIENSFVLGIDSKKLYKSISTEPQIAMKLIGILAQRIKYFVNMVENLTLSDVKTRLLNYLESLRKEHSKVIYLSVSKGDLALLMGTTPETLSRIFKKLNEDGLIEVRGKEIKLLSGGLKSE